MAGGELPAKRRVAVVAPSVSMAGSELPSKRRVAVVAPSVSMADGEIAARRRVAVVALSVSMAGGEIAAKRRVVASNCRPCFQPKTMLLCFQLTTSQSSRRSPQKARCEGKTEAEAE
jgi:hypothetical protein